MSVRTLTAAEIERAAVLVARGAKATDAAAVVTVNKRAQTSAAPQARDWPSEPELPGPPEPDPIPVEVLPPVLRDYVLSVAAATQTPPDLAALLALACVSAAVAGRVDVRVDASWPREQVTIYTVIILEPGARKSPVFALLLRPLLDWERERAEAVAPERRRALDRLAVAQRAHDAAMKATGAGKADAVDVRLTREALDAAEAAVPVVPRVVVSDVTPEALVRLLAEQGGRIALLAPEGDPLRIADGRYSGDGSARLDELKRAWSGEPIRVDRVGREPLHVERPALTLALTMQPGVLEGLANRRAFRGEGVFARVLWAVPPSRIGRRLTGRARPPLDELAGERYARALRKLLGLSGTHTLEMTEDALDVLYAFEAEIEAALAPGGWLAAIADAGAKAHGQAVRVAALLELAARAGEGRALTGEPIGRWAMEGAVRLVRAVLTHTRVVLAESGLDDVTADLRYVLRRARELPEGSTLRDLYRACDTRPGCETMEGLTRFVEALEERGCLRRVERRTGERGRPPSPVIELHPALRAVPVGQRARNANNPPGRTAGGGSGISGPSYVEGVL